MSGGSVVKTFAVHFSQLCIKYFRRRQPTVLLNSSGTTRICARKLNIGRQPTTKTPLPSVGATPSHTCGGGDAGRIGSGRDLSFRQRHHRTSYVHGDGASRFLYVGQTALTAFKILLYI